MIRYAPPHTPASDSSATTLRAMLLHRTRNADAGEVQPLSRIGDDDRLKAFLSRSPTLLCASYGFESLYVQQWLDVLVRCCSDASTDTLPVVEEFVNVAVMGYRRLGDARKLCWAIDASDAMCRAVGAMPGDYLEVSVLSVTAGYEYRYFLVECAPAGKHSCTKTGAPRHYATKGTTSVLLKTMESLVSSNMSGLHSTIDLPFESDGSIYGAHFGSMPPLDAPPPKRRHLNPNEGGVVDHPAQASPCAMQCDAPSHGGAPSALLNEKRYGALLALLRYRSWECVVTNRWEDDVLVTATWNDTKCGVLVLGKNSAKLLEDVLGQNFGRLLVLYDGNPTDLVVHDNIQVEPLNYLDDAYFLDTIPVKMMGIDKLYPMPLCRIVPSSAVPEADDDTVGPRALTPGEEAAAVASCVESDLRKGEPYATVYRNAFQKLRDGALDGMPAREGRLTVGELRRHATPRLPVGAAAF